MNWHPSDEEEEEYNNKHKNDETPILKDMLNDISFNGKKIKIPCKFKDLGEEYSVFDEIDFTKCSKSMEWFTITDKKTGNIIEIFGVDYVMHIVFLKLFDKNKNFITETCVDLNTNKIIGIWNDDFKFLKSELKLGNLGVGSTMNEVYAKLGLPLSISNVLNSATYKYLDKESGLTYYVSFFYFDKMANYKKLYGESSLVQNNLVTGIVIDCCNEED